jgi:hypothetical protein|eukprot:COSAG01_NODE_4073_length_5381_cov_3.511170_1_plen_81_part_00
MEEDSGHMLRRGANIVLCMVDWSQRVNPRGGNTTAVGAHFTPHWRASANASRRQLAVGSGTAISTGIWYILSPKRQDQSG